MAAPVFIPQTVEYLVRADRPDNPVTGDPVSPALADITRGDLVLYDPTARGARYQLDVTGAQMTAALDRVVDGASTVDVTLIDNSRDVPVILADPMLRRTSDSKFYARIVLDSLVFHLVAVKHDPRRVKLTLEEQPANALRQHDDPLSVSREQHARAVHQAHV
jgi:hypothetical protein